jgi:hypothetical protein
MMMIDEHSLSDSSSGHSGKRTKKTVFSVGTAALNIKFAVEFILGSAMIIIIYCSYKCFR